jgi:hypothetical protein
MIPVTVSLGVNEKEQVTLTPTVKVTGENP